MTIEITYFYEDGSLSCYEIEGKQIYCKIYYVEGKLHRLDGPAIEYENKAYCTYWINGVNIINKVKSIKEEDVPKYLSMLSL